MKERELFLAALDIEDPKARQAHLRAECAGDADLLARVESLLASHEGQSQFLSTPVVEQIADVSESVASATIAYESGSTHDDDPDATTFYSNGTAPMTKQQDDAEFETALGYLEPSSKPDSLGRLGHYEVLEVIGRGAFGTVLRAFDEKLHRIVAIKVMSPEMAATSPARKRFIREAQSSAAIRHEHVVSVYAVEEKPLPYLVMEFIPGETLQQRLDASGPLDVPTVLHLGRQIAEGLAAAHAQELIHRDIKPGNILLETSVHDRVKITDFGLARAADDASLTQSGTIAGTPMYMAPEQAMGNKIDQRADLFSFGSVLYQMVSGRPPFRAATTLAVLKRLAEDTPRPIREIIPETPQWLCDIITKLHAKNPDQRYQSAREIADVLANCESQFKAHSGLKDFTLIPRPESHPATSWRRVSAAVVVVLAVIGITEATGMTKFASTVVRLATGSGTRMSQEKGETNTKSEGSSQISSGSAAADYALSFNGTDDSISTPVIFDVAKPLTVEAKITVPNKPSHNQVALADAELGGFGLGPRENGKWRMDLQAQAGLQRDDVGYVRLESDNSIAYETPTHVATIYDGRVLRLYVNGRLQSKRIPVKDLVPSHLPIMIGANPGLNNKTGEHFLGMIDEVRISSVARYTGDFVPDERFESDEHTLALYHFDEGSGDVLKDSSGNGHHGKIVGAKWVRVNDGSNVSPTNVANADGWVPLFNGKDLTGWKTTDELPGKWEVVDGVLTGSSQQSYLFSERADFANFHLRVEAKTNGLGDSGIHFRAPFVLRHGSKAVFTQPASGYEVDLFNEPIPIGTITEIVKGASPRAMCMAATNSAYRAGEWFTLELIADGNRFITKINGQETVNSQDDASRYSAGHLAISVFDPRTVVQFRKIEIKELPPLPHRTPVRGHASSPPTSGSK